MKRTITTIGYLRIKPFAGYLVAMCDQEALKEDISSLRTVIKNSQGLVCGCSDIKSCDKAAVFYLYSWPIYRGYVKSKPTFFDLRETNEEPSAEQSMLKLCDYMASVKMVLNDKKYNLLCGVLAMDAEKRKHQKQAQIWIHSSTIKQYNEEEIDWIMRKLIESDFEPLIADTEMNLDYGIAVMCGKLYEGEL